MHHIIEQKFGPGGNHEHPLIAKLNWDIHDQGNLIGLPTKLGASKYGSISSIHQGPHSGAYDNYLEKELNSINQELEDGTITEDQARAKLNSFVQATREGLELGEIALNDNNNQLHSRAPPGSSPPA